ncbi:MAG: putative DNA binding domain-containing protein [Methanosarcinales archaeon]|nr:putative DNA binding domain-containing protein [Methanosarcinales archaeon]
MKILPINLEDLVHARSVESVRREFKKTWSEPIMESVIHSICAFANDFFNLNGGYIILGIEDKDGQPVLPPHGLEDRNMDTIQKQIRGNCKRIDPEYQPVLSPEIYHDKQILVIWVPGGELRPYQAPIKLRERDRAYFVRQGSESVRAQGDTLTQLMQMTAKVPFDDRRNNSVQVDVISPSLVRKYLADIRSDLVSPDVNLPDRDLYRYMKIVSPMNDHEAPKNVALLFFTESPEQYFPETRTEVVQFGDDAGGDLIEEKVFRGPIHFQLRQSLDYLNSFSTSMIKKIPGRAEAHKTVAFPYEAMEEALVNAVYHRSYEIREPIKVYLYPDRMEIISYPGPVPGIEMHHLQAGETVPPVQSRNRRIGEFLKELSLAEGRGTGIPKIRRKMRENGSPEPKFEFDCERTYFRVILPAHPQYMVIHALRNSAHLWATGERRNALANLEDARKRVPTSGAIVGQLIEYRASLGELSSAENMFNENRINPELVDRHLVFLAMAKAYLNAQNPSKASSILREIPSPATGDELIELAILYKRAGRFKEAHKVFASNFDVIREDPKAVHEYAQTKMRLTKKEQNASIRKRLNQDAAELLRRAIQLSDDDVRTAWCWHDLAITLNWLHAPETEVLMAYSKAMELLPNETVFRDGYERWKSNPKKWKR